MKRSEFRRSVVKGAREAMRRYGLRYSDIKIDERHETVAINGCVGFFAQGEEARKLIDNVPEDINPKTGIVFFLDSAGAI